MNKYTVTFRRSSISPARQQGFTLIELLVVVAIIALLAAILFPVFGRARANARRTNCMSNMKQIGLGLVQYTQDFDEAFPAAKFKPYGFSSDNSNASGCGSDCYKWMDSIIPYTKSTQIFTCPEAYTNSTPNPLIYVPNTTNQYGSYMMNRMYNVVGDAQSSPASYYSSSSTSPVYNFQAKLSMVETPSETVWVGDGTGNYEIYTYTTSDSVVVNSDPNTGIRRLNANGSYLYERHLQTCPVLFVDGHVKAMQIDALNARHTVAGKSVLYLFTNEDD